MFTGKLKEMVSPPELPFTWPMAYRKVPGVLLSAELVTVKIKALAQKLQQNSAAVAQANAPTEIEEVEGKEDRGKEDEEKEDTPFIFLVKEQNPTSSRTAIFFKTTLAKHIQRPKVLNQV
ncbi:MAG: hypothetical protein V4490_03930 [Pseudomonadota bacterium]